MKPIDAIFAVVSGYTGIPRDVLMTPTRGQRHLAHVRQMVYWLHRELTGEGMSATADVIGRDHTAVRMGLIAIERRRAQWGWFRKWSDELLTNAEAIMGAAPIRQKPALDRRRGVRVQYGAADDKRPRERLAGSGGTAA